MQTDETKALLDGLRVVVLAIVSYLLTAGVIGNILLLLHISMTPPAQLIIVGLLTSILKAIDKYLHSIADPNTGFLESRGLVGF